TNPLVGEKKKEKNASADKTTTTQGPVGMFGSINEIYAPEMPEKSAINTAMISILLSLFVQNFAAAAGVINNAAIKTTPMACIPVTTASTISELNKNSSLLTGKPMARAKSLLKISN